MNTLQSNTSSRSSATAVEQTEKFVVTLKVDPGYPLDLLYWALSSLRQRFYLEAANALASRDVPEYTDNYRRIQTLNEMIGDIVQQLGCAYTKLYNQQHATDLNSGLTEAWKEKEVEFANRFGFSKE